MPHLAVPVRMLTGPASLLDWWKATRHSDADELLRIQQTQEASQAAAKASWEESVQVVDTGRSGADRERLGLKGHEEVVRVLDYDEGACLR